LLDPEPTVRTAGSIGGGINLPASIFEEVLNVNL